MTLLLSNEEVEALLTMPLCLDAIEQACRDVGEGRAANGLRSEVLAPTDRTDGLYSLLTMSGVIPRFGMGAVRINSDILTWPRSASGLKRVKQPDASGRYTGLVMLFSTADGAPLAIFPDGVVQRMRVGAVCGLGAKYLARDNAGTVALLGTGWQAGAQAMAICAVRPIRKIVCYSPSPERCRAFAEEMAARLNIEVGPAASARDAVRGADVVMCATNSMQPVMEAEWLEPGMHLSSLKRLEIDATVAARADAVFTHVRDALSTTHRTAGADLARDTDAKKDEQARDLDLGRLPTLAELLMKKAAGRRTAEDITVFLNYAGMGYQFAATGYAVLRQAQARGIGRELPSDWFTGTVPS